MTPAMRQWLRDFIIARVSSIVRFSNVTLNTASGNGDKVGGHITFNDESEGGYDYTVRRLWPFGIRSRPPVNCDAVVVHAFGGSTNGVMVGAESPAYGPDDLEEGETTVYSQANPAILSGDEDGKTAITSVTNQPITIDAHGTGSAVVNGGTLEVARKTDPVSITGGSFTPASLTLTVKDSLGVSGSLVVTVAAGALVVTATGLTPGTFTMNGTITAGASRFKA